MNLYNWPDDFKKNSTYSNINGALVWDPPDEIWKHFPNIKIIQSLGAGVDHILTKKIQEITPNIVIVSEESASHKLDEDLKNFWLIDPIDGTRDYINNRDEFTLNAALILDKKPAIGIITVPAKKRFFYSYGLSNSYELIDGQEISLINKKKKS